MNSHLLPLFISYRSCGEKLIKYQATSCCVIMSVILMTTLFHKASILRGEVWCWSLLGLKGLSGGCISLQFLHPNFLQQILQYLLSLKVDIYIFKHNMQQTRIEGCFFFADYDKTPKIKALRPCKNLVSHRILFCCMTSCRESGGGSICLFLNSLTEY